MEQKKGKSIRLEVEIFSKGRIRRTDFEEVMGRDMRIHIGSGKLKEHMLDCVEKEGKVYVFRNRQEIISYFLFDKEEVDMNVLYIDSKDLLKEQPEEKEGEIKKQTVFKLRESFVLPELSDKLNKMKEQILKELRETCVLNGYAAIIWGEDIIRQKSYKIGKGYVMALPFGVGIGLIFGLALDNIALGICIGACLALVYSGAWTGIENQKKKREHNEK